MCNKNNKVYKRKVLKPIIKNNKFLNMSEELWRQTNEQSKLTRGCNLVFLDIKELIK
jgi:hypothetical protein